MRFIKFKIGDIVMCKPYGLDEMEGIIDSNCEDDKYDIWVKTSRGMKICSVDKIKLKNKWSLISI